MQSPLIAGANTHMTLSRFEGALDAFTQAIGALVGKRYS